MKDRKNKQRQTVVPDDAAHKRELDALVRENEQRSGVPMDDYTKFLLSREMWRSKYGPKD